VGRAFTGCISAGPYGILRLVCLRALVRMTRRCHAEAPSAGSALRIPARTVPARRHGRLLGIRPDDPAASPSLRAHLRSAPSVTGRTTTWTSAAPAQSATHAAASSPQAATASASTCAQCPDQPADVRRKDRVPTGNAKTSSGNSLARFLRHVSASRRVIDAQSCRGWPMRGLAACPLNAHDLVRPLARSTRTLSEG